MPKKRRYAISSDSETDDDGRNFRKKNLTDEKSDEAYITRNLLKKIEKKESPLKNFVHEKIETDNKAYLYL